MRAFRNHAIAVIAMLLFWTIQPNASRALAQGASPSVPGAHALKPPAEPGEDVNYDVQIYLMIGSNDAGQKARALPPNLEPVVRQIRASMPFDNYRVAATFLNRVRNGGSLQVNGVAGSLFASSPVPSSPTFYEFTLNDITAATNSAQQPLVQIPKFKFTMRVPLATANIPAQGNTGTSFPVISYEPTGINTRISLNAGVPTLVGTMTTGRSDESYIVVVNIRPSTDR